MLRICDLFQQVNNEKEDNLMEKWTIDLNYQFAKYNDNSD